MAIVKIHISELKTSMDEINFSGVTFCRSFFDGADVLTLREKKGCVYSGFLRFLRRKMSIE